MTVSAASSANWGSPTPIRVCPTCHHCPTCGHTQSWPYQGPQWFTTNTPYINAGTSAAGSGIVSGYVSPASTTGTATTHGAISIAP